MSAVGLIAGNGRFPVLFAQAARRAGVPVVAVAHRGESLPVLDAELPNLTWIDVGELQRIIDVFRAAGIERAVMAGGIHKSALLQNFRPDERAQKMLTRLTAWGDDAILRGVAAELEAEGIAIVSSTEIVPELLAPPGVIAGGEPDHQQWRDIQRGIAVAKAIGEWDIGQSVVLRAGTVLAVEAIEGTDATIERGGCAGAVVVKMSKPTQDMRFDVPAIGPLTVDTCLARGVAVLAVEAERTLILDRDEVCARARDLRIVGVRADGSR